MRARLIDRRGARIRLSAAGAVLALAASCSGANPDQVEASPASPEPTIETPASSEPTEEPSETEPSESEPEEPEPTIGEDEPLYAPLPELTADPENDVPDDLEQLILDAYADAYNTEFTAYTSGQVREEDLERLFGGAALEQVRGVIDRLTAEGLYEFSGDSTVDLVFIREFEGGSAVIRECVTLGPRTGEYTTSTGEAVHLALPGPDAREVLIELTGRQEDPDPRYRVLDIAFTDREGCDE